MGEADSPAASPPPRPTLSGHVQIARIDHWFKNVFLLPGIVVALSMEPAAADLALLYRFLVGMLSICLIASSNYVVNELQDAPFDRYHPTKHRRPVPSGRVSIPLAYVQWLGLMAAGMALAFAVSVSFALTMLVLWFMGCVYNIPPVRSKDLPYVDVLSESVNNPLRMLAGWFIVGPNAVAPASLLLSYWMIGCYFMAMKRYAEYRDINNPQQAAGYRRSFAFYTEERLLISIMFYGSAAMLFFGVFTMRYRLELIVAFPLLALVMAVYLALAFKPDSPVQRPEGLYREPFFMLTVVATAGLMCVLMLVDLPLLHTFFAPLAPVQPVP